MRIKVWEEPIEFDWDEGNIGKNLKHNVEDNGRFLFVSFTKRFGKVRIISARDMDREEELVYEKT